ncbi:MAG: hypothetical protein SFU56_03290 [Capsulimonadales bacterium]|nr:hypothetical protein [Capsulimonadales bacterium]
MPVPLRLYRTIPLLPWNDGVRERIMSYWRDRHFLFIETDGDFLLARRGSLWGNLTAFDPRKLKTELSIARTTPTEVMCLLEIDPQYQVITEWNVRFWELELETLESFLYRNDTRDALWQEFERDSARANALWVATGGVLGGRLTDRWKKH